MSRQVGGLVVTRGGAPCPPPPAVLPLPNVDRTRVWGSFLTSGIPIPDLAHQTTETQDGHKEPKSHQIGWACQHGHNNQLSANEAAG